MNITLVTSWGIVCGMAEYSKFLYESLEKRGHKVTILAPCPTTPLVSIDEEFVTRFDTNDTPENLMLNTNVVHIQMNAAIYSQSWMANFIRVAKSKGKKVVVTFHDGCQWHGDYPYDLIDVGITPSESITKHIPMKVQIVPQGILEVPIKITSFGLERNNNKEIAEICKELGFIFEISNYRNWKTTDELVDFIRQGDGSVFWYPPTDVAGESSCARLVISARRPLFIHDSTWFKGLAGVKDVHFFSSRGELKSLMRDYYHNSYIQENSCDNIARKHEELYAL